MNNLTVFENLGTFCATNKFLLYYYMQVNVLKDCEISKMRHCFPNISYFFFCKNSVSIDKITFFQIAQ